VHDTHGDHGRHAEPSARRRHDPLAAGIYVVDGALVLILIIVVIMLMRG
jgi:hypothetical protein